MTNTDALRRKLDRMIERVDAMRTPEQPRFDIYEMFDFSLFTESERSELRVLLDTVAPCITIHPRSGQHDLSQVPDQELARLQRWVYLKHALDRQDIDEIAEHRYILAHSEEEMIATFKAINIDSYQDHELRAYPLSRVGYNDLLLKCSRSRVPNIDNFYLWIAHDQEVKRR